MLNTISEFQLFDVEVFHYNVLINTFMQCIENVFLSLNIKELFFVLVCFIIVLILYLGK